jgi:hypothetical protein
MDHPHQHHLPLEVVMAGRECHNAPMAQGEPLGDRERLPAAERHVQHIVSEPCSSAVRAGLCTPPIDSALTAITS